MSLSGHVTQPQLWNCIILEKPVRSMTDVKSVGFGRSQLSLWTHFLPSAEIGHKQVCSKRNLTVIGEAVLLLFCTNMPWILYRWICVWKCVTDIHLNSCIWIRLQATKRNNSTVEMTAEYFIVATGERPRYPDVPGIKEFSITRYTSSSFLFFFCLSSWPTPRKQKYCRTDVQWEISAGKCFL